MTSSPSPDLSRILFLGRIFKNRESSINKTVKRRKFLGKENRKDKIKPKGRRHLSCHMSKNLVHRKI